MARETDAEGAKLRPAGAPKSVPKWVTTQGPCAGGKSLWYGVT